VLRVASGCEADCEADDETESEIYVDADDETAIMELRCRIIGLKPGD